MTESIPPLEFTFPRFSEAFAPASCLEGLTVLLAEDEGLVRVTARKMLEFLGVKVFEAVDGVDALGTFLVHQEEIHCVLSDVHMPQMDGWRAMEAIRRIRPGTPFILSSSIDLDPGKDEGESPQAFLPKPYCEADLRNALLRALAAGEDGAESPAFVEF